MSPPPEGALAEFSSEERTLLLKLAHEAIATAAAGRKFLPEVLSAHLSEPRGAFTTANDLSHARRGGRYPTPLSPLYRPAAHPAQAAAFDDPRFPALRADEVPALEVSLSILSPLRAINPNDIEIGRHGLVVGLSNQRGLLLPQVPVEHGWERVTFLEQTCRKAGLPLDAWEHGASVDAFTAEVFGDRWLLCHS